MAEIGVYKAINAVQAELCKEGISKSSKNQTQGYNFRGIDAVYNALSPILSDKGLCIIPNYTDRTITENQSRNGGVLFNVVVKGTYTIVATSDGSQITAQMYGEAMDSADKATNKAMSAAYKYLCLQLFAIPTEGDNDADATTHEVRGSQAAANSVATQKIKQLKTNAKAQQPDKLKELLGMDADDAFAELKEMLSGLAGIEFARQCYDDLKTQGISPKNDPEMFIKGLYNAYVSNQPPKEPAA